MSETPATPLTTTEHRSHWLTADGRRVSSRHHGGETPVLNPHEARAIGAAMLELSLPDRGQGRLPDGQYLAWCLERAIAGDAHYHRVMTEEITDDIPRYADDFGRLIAIPQGFPAACAPFAGCTIHYVEVGRSWTAHLLAATGEEILGPASWGAGQFRSLERARTATELDGAAEVVRPWLGALLDADERAWIESAVEIAYSSSARGVGGIGVEKTSAAIKAIHAALDRVTAPR